MKKKIEISVSKDTLKWFSKLTLTQKLKCIEEHVKFWYIFKRQNQKRWKNRITVK